MIINFYFCQFLRVVDDCNRIDPQYLSTFLQFPSSHTADPFEITRRQANQIHSIASPHKMPYTRCKEHALVVRVGGHQQNVHLEAMLPLSYGN